MLCWPFPIAAQGIQYRSPVLFTHYEYGLGSRLIPYALALPQIATKAPKRPVANSYGNCVAIVRSAGYFVPRSLDGYARTIPVTSTDLPPENALIVIKTAESWMGHVLVAINRGGVLTSVIDSVGAGRVIDLSLYRGYI